MKENHFFRYLFWFGTRTRCVCVCKCHCCIQISRKLCVFFLEQVCVCFCLTCTPYTFIHTNELRFRNFFCYLCVIDVWCVILMLHIPTLLALKSVFFRFTYFIRRRFFRRHFFSSFFCIWNSKDFIVPKRLYTSPKQATGKNENAKKLCDFQINNWKSIKFVSPEWIHGTGRQPHTWISSVYIFIYARY